MKENNEVLLGMYNKAGEDKPIEFRLIKEPSLMQKAVFVSNVVNAVVDDNYFSFLKEPVFDYMLIRAFTDIDCSSVEDDDIRGPKNKIDALEQFLNGRGIGTNKHYPIPMHLQQCYGSLGFREGDFPIAEEISRTELSLPIYAGMPEEDVDRVIRVLNEYR